MPPQIGFSGFPTNLDLYKNNCPPLPFEGLLVGRFRAKMKVYEGCELHFTNLDRETGELQEFRTLAKNSSRYFYEGRGKIKRKLRKRLGTRQEPGCLLTLTCDPKKYGKLEAWERIWKEYAAFRRDLWKFLKRQGRKHNPLYIGVIESQKSGYPHLHIVYPGLKYLAPKEVINKCWHMGTTHIAGRRRKGRRDGAPVLVNALPYVLKYVTKLAGWSEEGLAYLWHTRARLYNISPKLYASPKAPKVSGWMLTKITYVDEAVRYLARRLARLRLMDRDRKREEVPMINGS
jgi:hypothetical protein